VPVILASLQSLTQAGRQTFLPDSMSLLGEGIHREHLLSSGQITDSYLLRLATNLLPPEPRNRERCADSTQARW